MHLPSRGRLLRIATACVLFIAVIYLGAVGTRWKWEPQSGADDKDKPVAGQRESAVKLRQRQSPRFRAVHRHSQHGGQRSGDVMQDDAMADGREMLSSRRSDTQKSARDRKGDQSKKRTIEQSKGEDVSLNQVSQVHRRMGVEPEVIPPALVGLISSLDELKGRHSDYITEPCQNKSSPPRTGATVTDKKYGFLGPFPYLQDYKNPCWLPGGSARVKCVPYFYLIGAPKAGSTDVFWRIKGHPHVTSGKAKEVRWFDRLRFPLEKGSPAAMPTFDNYLEFFERPTGYIQDASVMIKNGTPFHHRVLADGSPTYYYSSFNWPLLPGNEGCDQPRVTAMSHIHHLWPQAKLILVLRNPVTRLFSTYLYNTHLPGFNTSAAQFDLWVKKSMDTWFRCLGTATFRHCMYNRQVIYESAISTFAAGIYSRYVLDLLKLFPRRQIYFVHLESYSSDIRGSLREIYAFLNLPPLSEDALAKVSKKDESRRNRGRNYAAVPEMWPSTRKLLEHFYAPYNKELSAILDGDPKWLW